MKTIEEVKANDAFLAVISGLHRIELSRDLPDDPQCWLDEDHPLLTHQDFKVLDALLWSLDTGIGVRETGGFDVERLLHLSRLGFRVQRMSLGRVSIQTIKGKILAVKPY